MNVQEERTVALRHQLRAEGLLTQGVAAQLATRWRTNRILVQAVFFVLTALAGGAFYGLCHVLEIPRPGIVTAIAVLATAEFLIRAQRWFWTGVESALWLGGMFALISELPRSGTPESILVVAAAFAIPAWRVRNPLFGACAAVALVAYGEEKFDGGVVVALLIAAAAMLALLREWRRPSTEWLWIAIALTAPIGGAFCADERWRPVTIALYSTCAVLALTLALMRRHHAHFFAALICAAIAAIYANDLIPLPLEAKLAIAGGLLLALAFALSRFLRERTHGLVVKPVRSTESLEIVATLAAQPHVHAPEPQPEGGGAFGGAGASGKY